MMNQQINLYLPEFKVKKDPLTAVLMAQILAGVMGVMVLFSAYQGFTRWQLTAELERLQASLREETQKTSELDDVLARRSQNTELTERLEQAELRLESRRQIRDFLGQTQLGNVMGFSEYFKDLSRATMDGLSLTEFAFTNGGSSVKISGQVVDSSMVPMYVNNLETGRSPLRRQQFSPSISRSTTESPHFLFSLSSLNE